MIRALLKTPLRATLVFLVLIAMLAIMDPKMFENEIWKDGIIPLVLLLAIFGAIVCAMLCFHYLLLLPMKGHKLAWAETLIIAKSAW